MHEHRQLLTKWLKILMYVHIASIAISIISMFSFKDSWNTWTGIAITLAGTVCMYAMAPINRRYKTAGNLYAVYLVCAVLNQTALALVASILSLIAMYQEYSAHSELVADMDPNLSANWHSLFNWQIFVGVAVSVISIITVLLMAAVESQASRITAVVVIFGLADLLLTVVYIQFVRQMIGYCQAK